MKNLNRDFYDRLPGIVCVQLEDVFIPKYGKEKWFETAWEEYRQHIKSSDMDTMLMPYAIFKKYVKED
jgi:hypothetical protein